MSNQKLDVYNKVVTFPSLLLDKSRELVWVEYAPRKSKSKMLWIRDGLDKFTSASTGVVDKTAVFKENAALIGEALETYTIEMVANCANKLYMPNHNNTNLPISGISKHNLTLTLQSKISFLDSRKSLLLAIMRYIKPIIYSEFAAFENEERRLVWNLYLLILGARTHSEVVVSPEEQLRIIEVLKTKQKLSREAKARLAVIEGVYRAYSKPEKIPGFKFYPSGQSLYERLEEIVDDAYILEASQLRRLFGLKANIAKTRKSLRQLIRFISTHSSWAKGVVKAAEFTGYIPSGNPLDELIDSLPLQSVNDVGPVCIDPIDYRQHITSGGRTLIEFFWTPNISGERFFEDTETINFRTHISKS